MIRSFLIGLVAGSRAITPLATVSDAARRGALPGRNPDFAWLGHPFVSEGLKLLAAGEFWGDKMQSAPDRIGASGMIARVLTGGLAGAALAPRGRVRVGGALGAVAAVAAAYLTYEARMRAMRHFGQASTGVVEDALTLAAARCVIAGAPGPAEAPLKVKGGWRRPAFLRMIRRR